MKLKFAVRSRILFSLFALVQLGLAADPELAFKKIAVPGATCGDGSPYSVYLRSGDKNKVMVHFQGGGACWDFLTCFGPTPFTRLKDSGSPTKTDIYTTANIGDHPFVNYTYIFIPYCTGDMHIGDHQISYGLGSVQHRGKGNTKKVLDLIESEYSHLISRAANLVVYGESAGALGAMLNMEQINKLNPAATNKSAILDSPGLHFSSAIWGRFPSAYLDDISNSMSDNGLELDTSTGIIAKQMRTYCNHYSDWKMGVIQSTEDSIMSWIFGMTLPFDHRKAVLGPDGIYQTLLNSHDPCSAWVPDSSQHVWAIRNNGWLAKTSDGSVLKDYVENIVQSDLNDDFSSHK